jgi:hypothetical protein
MLHPPGSRLPPFGPPFFGSRLQPPLLGRGGRRRPLLRTAPMRRRVYAQELRGYSTSTRGTGPRTPLFHAALTPTLMAKPGVGQLPAHSSTPRTLSTGKTRVPDATIRLSPTGLPKSATLPGISSLLGGKAPAYLNGMISSSSGYSLPSPEWFPWRQQESCRMLSNLL